MSANTLITGSFGCAQPGRMRQLREAVAGGAYRVDEGAVADAIIRRLATRGELPATLRRRQTPKAA